MYYKSVFWTSLLKPSNFEIHNPPFLAPFPRHFFNFSDHCYSNMFTMKITDTI